MSKIINVIIDDSQENTVSVNPVSFLGDAHNQMVYVTQMIDSINENYRSVRNRKLNIRLNTAMLKRSFAESAIALESELTGNDVIGISNYIEKDSRGRITNISKLCPTVIQTRRGRYAGTWMHKRLVISMLSSIDGFIANQIQKVLIEQDIFGTRNQLTIAQKTMTDAIHSNPNFRVDNHTYCNIGKLIKKAVDYDNVNNISNDKMNDRISLSTEMAVLAKYGHLNGYQSCKDFITTKTIEGENQ